MSDRSSCRAARAAVLLAAAALAGGCEPQAAVDPEPEPIEARYPREFLQEQWEAQEVPVAHIVRRDYRIREGDFLEIIYHVKHRTSEVYRIKVQDVIEVRFPFNPDLNQTETVQSDGKLYLDMVEPEPVIGRTIEEVRASLMRKYARYIKNPKLTVSFEQSNVKTAELKKAITTSPRGQSRLVPVTPDGTISLPFVVDVRAAGRTIGELHKALNDAYKEIDLPQLEVTVNLQQVAPMRVYVLGEVRNPGVLLNRSGTASDTGEVSLLQAIAGEERPEECPILFEIWSHVMPNPSVGFVFRSEADEELYLFTYNATDEIDELYRLAPHRGLTNLFVDSEFSSVVDEAVEKLYAALARDERFRSYRNFLELEYAGLLSGSGDRQHFV